MQNLCYESTSKCILNCPYCISSDNGNMCNDNYEEIIDFIGRLLPERLVISGGEPLLDNNLKKKINLIIEKYEQNNLKPYISLATSGTLKIDNNMFDFFKDNIQCIDFSIPTLNNNVYKQMRGTDLLNIALLNVKQAVEHGLNVRISIILTKYNYYEIPELLLFASKIGVNSVRIGRYFPFRNAANVKDDFEIDEELIQDIIKMINNGVYKNIYSGKIIPPIKSLDMMNGYLNIDFNGNIFFPSTNGKNIICNSKECDISKLEKMFSNNQQKIFIKSKEKI